MNINIINFESSFYGRKKVNGKNVYLDDDYGIKRGRRTQRSKSTQYNCGNEDCFICRNSRVKGSPKRANIMDAPVYGCADY